MTTKVFASNPLALSVPDVVFETWLRDTGYLEILDQRTTTAAAAACPPPSAASIRIRPIITAAIPTKTSSSLAGTLSFFRTLAAVLTLNPFAKLTAADLSRDTPAWTIGFIGGEGSYSWPAGPSQARMRIHENVRRYARNYAYLAVIFFACSLYQLPVSLLGAVATLVIWELMRICSDKWELEQKHPVLRQFLVRTCQIATPVILFVCNLQLALICAISVSYTVMILHASLRKLTPAKQNQDRRSLQKKLQISVK